MPAAPPPARLRALGLTAVVVAVLLALVWPSVGSTAAVRMRSGMPKPVAGPHATSASPTHVDPAPPGVDPRARVSTTSLRGRELAAQAGARGRKARRAATAPLRAAGPVPPGTSLQPTQTTHVDTACTGTGVDGNRVEVLYVVERGAADRYADVLPTLRTELANVDDTFAASSAPAGSLVGDLRVRWVLDPATCLPHVRRIEVPAGTLTSGGAGASFDATVAAVESAGYADPARKYLMFADVDASGLCGIGEIFGDESAVDNLNDGVAGTAMYARVDTACWVQPAGWHSTAAHELMHMLGGVQEGAPHATAYGHCTDEHDVMCYDDGSPGVTMSEQCAAPHEAVFDCNGDDYFSTEPVAGSYLATHWNTANSSFLESVAGSATAPVVTVAGSTSVRAGLPAAYTATSTLAGGTWTWVVTPEACRTAEPLGPRLTVQCPTSVGGSVTVTARQQVPGHPRGTGSRSTALTGSPAATLTTSIGRSTSVVYPGQPVTLTGAVRWGSVPVNAQVELWYTADGGATWQRYGSPVVTGTDGVTSWTVRPAHSTGFALRTAVVSGGGWVPPPGPTTVVSWTRWPSSIVMTVRPSSPVVLTALLRNSRTAAPLAGATVTLQRQWYGTTAWAGVGAWPVSAGGVRAVAVAPGRPAYYRWVYAGSGTIAGSVSAAAFVRR